MAKETFNFKEALLELKEINEEFDQEDIDLDRALEKFKRGLVLAQQCKERLKEVENEVVKIKEKFGQVKAISGTKPQIGEGIEENETGLGEE